MRGKTIAWLGLALAVLAVAGCKPRPMTVTTPPPPPTPLSFTQETPDATVSLAIAPAIATWPELHKKLYDEGVAELKRDIEAARNDRSHLEGEGFPNPAYDQSIRWNLNAWTPRLVGLKGTWDSYTGGAHPNNGYNTLIWDTNAKSAINRSELFIAPGPGDAAMQTSLCDAIAQARKANGVEVTPDIEESWPCPKWRDSDFVLAQSATPGKLGGLTFVFDPYAIGSYAEGPYEATVPYAAFKTIVAPAYAGEFADGPLRAPPVRK